MLALTAAALALILIGSAMCICAAHIPVLRALTGATPLETETTQEPTTPGSAL